MRSWLAEIISIPAQPKDREKVNIVQGTTGNFHLLNQLCFSVSAFRFRAYFFKNICVTQKLHINLSNF